MQRKTRVQHCSSCKNHGMTSAKRNHKCDYQDCKCILCELLQRSQKVMRHQQRVWRHQKLKLRPDNYDLEDPSNLLDQSGKAKCQVCDKCRNHNKLVPKRNHQCKHAQCACVYCNLTSKRRDLMKYLQRVRRSGVISDANPEVRKARKFLDDNESQFEFADDESGATDEDDVQEDTHMDNDELEETQGDGEQLITSEERVSLIEYPNPRTLHPKKQRLLDFYEGEIDSSFLAVPEVQSLDLLVSRHCDRKTPAGSKQFIFKHCEEESRLHSTNTSQSREVITATNPTFKLRRPIAIDSSPPPLIQMSSRPSSAEGVSFPRDVSFQSREEMHKKQDHNSVLNRLSLECNSPSGYPVRFERAQEEEPRTLPSPDLNHTSLPPRLPISIPPTDMPLYFDHHQPAMQGNLSPNHLQHLRLQYAALFMCQRSPLKYEAHQDDLPFLNNNWSSQSVPPSMTNYHNIGQPLIRPFAMPINVSHPYDPMRTIVNNIQWNQRNMHNRPPPTFMSEEATDNSSISRPLPGPAQRCHMLNPF